MAEAKVRSKGFAVKKVRPGEAGSSLKGGSSGRILGAISSAKIGPLDDPKRDPKADPMFRQILEQFWDNFGNQFRHFFGKDGQDRAQEGQQEPQSTEKLHLQKPSKTFKFVLRFLGSKTAQDSLRRPRKAPQRHLRSSKS